VSAAYASDKGQDPYNDAWKTGQRVPVTGKWVDQHGTETSHVANGTFPPCIGRKGECAYRRLV
jgi:hypothetical protein